MIMDSVFCIIDSCVLPHVVTHHRLHSLINMANVKLKFLIQLIFVLIDHRDRLKTACANRDICDIGCECM